LLHDSAAPILAMPLIASWAGTLEGDWVFVLPNRPTWLWWT
jgi:hypothetical protein